MLVRKDLIIRYEQFLKGKLKTEKNFSKRIYFLQANTDKIFTYVLSGF